MNIGSEFDGRIGGDVVAAVKFLESYEVGDVISYEDMDDAPFSDPGWHAIRDSLHDNGDGFERLK